MNTLLSKKSGELEVSAIVQDIISAFYYLRRRLNSSLKEGDEIQIETFIDDMVLPINIKYVGKESIRTKLGRINCLKFSPTTNPGRVFKTQNDLMFWVSDDENYIPLRIKLNLKIGSLKCDLIEYSGLKTEKEYDNS